MSARENPPCLVHGHARSGQVSPEFRAWNDLRYRARKQARSDSEPGTLTLGVCARWMSSFQAFLDDLGPKPSPRHELQRRDPQLDYGPGNCAWGLKAGARRRGRNTTRYVEIDGRRVAVVDVAAAHGVHRDTLIKRLDRGVPLAEAIQIPARTSASREARS
ncbi:hypothetical protein MKL09_31590 [Methylobacterium sp. J-048]|uniref:hypothetical protein n=1 Tax=Methylobacterium sp. J-048 TaxID=2836635 RepID=UPI001FB8A5C4|nr:hypothetical protein [Methylobacterium sp. J-048]MCJ2061049.1 hypothetical protein [Methylobacterium sp. J-048]